MSDSCFPEVCDENHNCSFFHDCFSLSLFCPAAFGKRLSSNSSYSRACPFPSSLRPPLHKLCFICVSPRVPWERCIDNFLQKYDSSLFYREKFNSAASNWIVFFSGVENNREREETWPQTFYMRLLLNRDLIELQGYNR